MAKGANLAGKAINISKTTACHAVSYPITSHFNIPHGHAVALTLGEMMAYNYELQGDCLDPRGEEYVKETIKELFFLLKSTNLKEAKEKLNGLMDSIALERKLSALGINNVNIIIEEGFNPERVKNNPRELKKETLKRILDHII